MDKEEPVKKTFLDKAQDWVVETSKTAAKEAAKSAANNPRVMMGIGIGAGLILAPQITIGALLGAGGFKKFGKKKSK